jgi:hypothetical protein
VTGEAAGNLCAAPLRGGTSRRFLPRVPSPLRGSVTRGYGSKAPSGLYVSKGAPEARPGAQPRRLRFLAGRRGLCSSRTLNA